MGIYRHRYLAKGSVEHHVRRLPANPWQGFQKFPFIRHLGAVLLYENLACLDDIHSLGIEQTNRLNVFLESGYAERVDLLGSVGYGIEFFCCLIDANIGRLRRQDYRYK